MMTKSNLTSQYQFTIVVPIYNETETLLRLGKELQSFLVQAPVSSCVLLVNDGSADNSLDGIRDLCKLYPHFYYLSFAKNCGLSAALKAGIDYCESPYLGYIDADLQTSPMDFNLLLADAPDYELVTGVRANRNDSGWRRFQSKFANGFRRMMTGDKALDTGCPLKVMHTSAAKQIPFFKGMHRFLPAMISLQDGKMKQIEVRHFPRLEGKSKFSMRNRFWGPLADCFAFRWMKKRYIRYTVAENNV